MRGVAGRPRKRLGVELLESRVLPANSAYISMPTNLSANQGTVVTVPVTINHLFDAAGNQGLAGADVTLTYDPNVFTVGDADITVGSLLTNPPPNGTWNFVENTATPGEVDLSVSTSSATAFVTSMTGGILADISFHVKGAAPTGNSTIQVVTPPASSPNGNSTDALPATGPNSPSGDFAGYTLSAADQVNGVVNIQNFSPVTTLSLPVNLPAIPGQTITVPVNIANPDPVGSAGMISADTAIIYDPNVLTVASAGAVALGSDVPATGWSLTYGVDTSGNNTVDSTKAALGLHLTNTNSTPLTSTSAGSLWLVTFTVNAAAPTETTILNLVPSARVGASITTTNVTGANKVYQLTPAPTNATTDTVDGSVQISGSTTGATHFSVSGPATATAGTAASFTVTALDASNNPVSGYTGTVHFTSTDGQAVLPANAMLTNGVGTFNVTFHTSGNQTVTATDTVTSSITGTSGPVAVSAAAATHFSVSAPSSATAGSAFNFTVTAQDQFNNTATGYSGTVHFTSTDGQAVLPANSTLTSGVGTFSVTLKTAGNQTLTATDTATSTITGTSAAIAVSAAAATHFSVTAPATATVGTAFSVTVTALDPYNNTATGYTGTVHFTSTDGSAVLPANSTLTNGTHTFSATLQTAGNQTLTATDTVTSTITGTSAAISVSASTASSAYISMPTNLSANQGTVVTVPVTINHLFDAAGNQGLAGADVTLTYDPNVFTVGDADITVGSLLTNPPPNGTWNFVENTATPGEVDLSVSTSSATAFVTSMTGGILADISFHVKGAAPTGNSTIQVVTPPASSPNGNSTDALPATGPNSPSGDFAGYTLSAADQVNGVVNIQNFSPVTTLSLPVNLPAIPGQTITVPVNIANPDPVGSAGMISADTAIIYDPNVLTVASAGAVALGSDVPATGWSLTYGVDTSGNNTVDSTKAALGLHLTNTNSTPLTSTSAGSLWLVTFTVNAAAPTETTILNLVPSARVGASITTTNVTGANKVYQLTPAPTNATTDTVDGSVQISGSTTGATHFSVSGPATATAGTAASFTVTALDASNNPVSGYTGTVHFTSTDGQAVLPANAMLTNGVGTFNVTFHTSGNQTVTATDTVTSSITGTSGPVAVSAAAATHFSVSAPSSVAAGSAFNVTVTAQDQFNNTATSYTGTVHFTSTDGQAVLPANSTLTNGTGTFSVTLKTAGNQTLTATDTATSTITGTSAAIAVSAAAATHFSVTAPATATAGSAFNVTVTAQDQFNNTATSYSGTVHFTSTDGQAVLPANSTLTNGTGTFSVTLKTAGNQTLTATDTATSTITGTSAAIAVSAAAATHFSVTAPATATVGTAFSVTVTALDPYNNTATGYTGTVHFTSTDGSAVLPANSTLTNGTHTFSATLQTAGNQTLTATDTVTSTITGTSAAISVSASTASSAYISMPTNLSANQGTVVTVPVTINHLFDAAGNQGLAGADVTLTYDPNVFTVGDADITVGSLLTNPPPNGTWNFVENTATPGEVDLSVSTSSATAFVTSMTGGILADISFHVKGAAPTGNSTIQVVTPPASSPNGNSTDALPATGPNSPSGDFAGYTLSAADQVNGVVNIQNFSPVTTLSLPINLPAIPGQTITVPVNIANPDPVGSAGMISADTAIIYDPNVLTVASAGAVALGSDVPATGWSLTYGVDTSGNNTVDSTKAALGLHLTNTNSTPLTSTSAGSLWLVTFTVNAAAPTETTILNLVPSARVGASITTTNVTGANKVYQLTPAPTNATTDTVDGSVQISGSTTGATHFSVSGPATATAGTAASFTVTALDASNNPVSGYTGTVHFTSTDGQAVLPANAMLTNGVGTFNVTFHTSGNQTVTATDTVTSSITGTSGPVAVSAAAATHFSVSAPSSATAGSAFNVTVTAQDAFNNTATSYSGTVHFTSTDGQAVLPANSTLTNGTGTFSVTLKTAGNQTLTATDTVTSTITGTSGTIAVSAAAATHFSVSAPSSATAGSAFNVTVTAQDAFNNTATGYSGTVHFTSTDGSATLPVNNTLTNGVGTFSATLQTAGNQTLTATDTVTSTITGTSNTITVSTFPATHFAVSAPSSATAGSAFTFTVTALDASNNPTTGYSGTVHFASSDGQAVLPADTTLTNGTGTFSVTLKTAGSQTLTATDTTTSTITGTSAAIAVSAAAATHFSVTAPATATAGSAFNFTVTAQDAFNNAATGYTGTVHFTSSDGQAVLPANSTLTNGTGTFSVTLKTAGNQTVTATDTVTSTITGTSAAIAVSAAAATHFSVTAPATATAGSAFNFTVTAQDAFNNTATGYSGTVHFTSSDGQAVLPANSTLTSGVGTFSVTLKTAGNQTITATDTVTSTITGTSAAIAVSAAAATHFSVTAPATATAGSAFNFTVTAQDAFNNAATGYSGTVHFTSSDGQAVLPANSTLTNGTGTFSVTLKTAGNQTVTATDTVTSTITGTSAAIAVSAAAATHFTVTAPATATAGSAFNFTVTAQDAFNNTATGYSGTVHFTSSDGQAVLPANSTLTNGTGTFSVTLKTAGNQTLTATDTVTSTITGTSAAIAVSAAAATHFSVTAPATATAGSAFNVTVTGRTPSTTPPPATAAPSTSRARTARRCCRRTAR